MISESILTGRKVRLRPVEEADLPHFARWLADREVTRWLAAIGEPPTLEDEYEWWHEKRSDPNNVMWSIESLEGVLVGNVELRLSPKQRRAEMGIAIQDRRQWGKGLGTDTVGLVIDYAFRELDLNRVELTTDEENVRAIRCYEKAGFVREGLLRQHRLIDGRFGNTLAMAILRHDWAAGRSSNEGGATMIVSDIVLAGEKCRLRPPTEDDIPRLVRWLNNFEVRHWLHHSERPEATLESVTERFFTNWNRASNILWMIETLDARPIGNIRLLDIDPHHRRAELAIMIGETDCWGRGYGTDAIRQALRYGFEEVGLRRVELQTDADNLRGIRCYEKCGFVREGLLRARRLRYGRPIAMLAMSVLREEFER